MVTQPMISSLLSVHDAASVADGRGPLCSVVRDKLEVSYGGIADALSVDSDTGMYSFRITENRGPR